MGKNDAFTYSHEMRYEISGEKIQKKRQITAREYIELSESTDTTKKRIIKQRQCFIYERQYFMVETFMNLENNPSILRVESTKERDKTKLPPFIKIIREVTNEDTYETWFMAKENYEMPEADVIAIQESLLEERANEPAKLLAKINSAKNRPSSALRRMEQPAQPVVVKAVAAAEGESVTAEQELASNVEESKI